MFLAERGYIHADASPNPGENGLREKQRETQRERDRERVRRRDKERQTITLTTLQLIVDIPPLRKLFSQNFCGNREISSSINIPAIQYLIVIYNLY